MRIGLLIPGWPPEVIANGIATALGRLGKQLRLTGHEVFYVTSYLDPRTRDEHVWVIDYRTSLVERIHMKLDYERGYFR
jgi:hypothetical protein